MAEKRLVWDLPVRLFHWLLVLSILAAYLTREFETREWHMRIGYWTIGLVLFRLIWGFVGPRHARFSNFIRPGKVGSYLGTVFRRDATPSIGHNPLGGIMVLVMLLMVLAQAVSGLFITDDIAKSNNSFKWAWAGHWHPAQNT